MIVIADTSYTLKALKFKSQTDIASNIEDWEKDIWSFLKHWFSSEEDYIEIKTSGSTGPPKTIEHKKKYMLASAKMTCAYFNLSQNNAALLCLSIKSVGGIMMMLRALVSEMNLICIKPSSNPLKYIDTEIDFVAMVPFQVQNVFIENPTKWELIDKLIIGGGVVSNTLTSDIQNVKLNAYSTYGMTETISHIALNKIGTNSIYTTLNNVSISKNADDCLVISAPNLGLESLETTDIIEIVDENQFIWKGRKDNAIESGGVKFIPELIEKKIAHLINERFFISSIPDKLLNNKLVLVIETENEDFSLKALEHLLDKYEMPKHIFYLKKIIETETGKVNRKESMNLLYDKL